MEVTVKKTIVLGLKPSSLVEAYIDVSEECVTFPSGSKNKPSKRQRQDAACCLHPTPNFHRIVYSISTQSFIKSLTCCCFVLLGP
jgi:hypothetical protein